MRAFLAQRTGQHRGPYCAISHGIGQDRELRRAFRRFPGLGGEPALPLFLRLYREWMVDIIPLRHQLRCYLNTTREQLSDSHGIIDRMIDRCRDPLRPDSHRVLLPVLRAPGSPDPLASTSGPPRSGS